MVTVGLMVVVMVMVMVVVVVGDNGWMVLILGLGAEIKF